MKLGRGDNSFPGRYMLSSSGRNLSVRLLGGSIRLNSEGAPIVGRRDVRLLGEKLAPLDALDVKSRPSVNHCDGR